MRTSRRPWADQEAGNAANGGRRGDHCGADAGSGSGRREMRAQQVHRQLARRAGAAVGAPGGDADGGLRVACERQAATLTGACEWRASQSSACQPQTRHPDAINILTYHGAKGLEWPMVILTELDAQVKGSPFGLIAEDEQASDWRAPQIGRAHV